MHKLHLVSGALDALLSSLLATQLDTVLEAYLTVLYEEGFSKGKALRVISALNCLETGIFDEAVLLIDQFSYPCLMAPLASKKPS